MLPTRLPLAEFYEELVDDAARDLPPAPRLAPARGTCAGIVARLLLRGQTNFVKSLFKLNSVYRPELLLADHARPVAYEIPLPPQAPHARAGPGRRPSLYIHAPRGRAGRAIDAATEPLSTRRGWAPRRRAVPRCLYIAHNAAVFGASRFRFDT